MQIEFDNVGRGSGFNAGCHLPMLLAVLCMACWLPSARAIEVTSLYTVEVPFDPAAANAENAAYRAALAEILVRVTGSEAAAESAELANLFPNPARYVTRYQPGEAGSLIVSMDGPAIEEALRQAGATVWDADRPLTIVWLAVDWGSGDRQIVAADDPTRGSRPGRTPDRDQHLRERVREVALRRGLPIVFPLMDVEDLENIGFVDIWGGFDEPLLEASARYEAGSVLVGRIRPNDRQPPRWTWYFDGQRFAWPGEVEESVNQLADALAARDAVRGSQDTETIRLTISGIDSMRAYGEVQRYMENLRIVDELMMRTVASDRITYAVKVQGGLERLDNALSTSRILERAEPDYMSAGFEDEGDLRYRYRQARKDAGVREPLPLPGSNNPGF